MNNWEHKRILVTRPAHQAQGLIHLLSGKGASVLLFPTLIIHPVTDLERLKKEIRDQMDADWLIFISPNAVDHVMPIVLEEQWLKAFKAVLHKFDEGMISQIMSNLTKETERVLQENN